MDSLGKPYDVICWLDQKQLAECSLLSLSHAPNKSFNE